MSSFDFDLFVIGAGSGGVRASRVAAGLGARVGIAESDRVGGTCVIRGCIPKKLLSYAAHFHEDFEDAAGYGWTVERSDFSWPRLIANKDREIDRLNEIYIGLLRSSGVELIQAHAELQDAHHIRIGERTVSARYVLIATGGRPVMPDLPGVEHAISSNEAFELPELPRRVVIAGGGYIALEFAGIFNGLGAVTTLVHRGEQVLRGFDHDLRAHLAAEMHKKGVVFNLGSTITRVDKQPAGALRVVLNNGSAIECDCVMFATGRAPNTTSLGLERAGVALGSDRAIAVDAYSKTNIDNIYAVGDVTDRLALTPVAIKEGSAVAMTLFGDRPTAACHDNVPSAVFSHPQVGTVGLSETEARMSGRHIDVYRSEFRALKHTLSGRPERTLMKLVVDAGSQVVLGAHMVGADAAEIIQGIAIAVRAQLTKQDFDETVGIHPSAAEEFVTMREKLKP